MLARLAFVMLTVSPVDLLILDEPTNNLDIETVDAIIEILSEYQGGLIVISHDIDFLERLQIQKAIVLGDTQKTVQIDEGMSLHDII
jgi:ATPase subunit of ABC transporter with duplicated ATPase domains